MTNPFDDKEAEEICRETISWLDSGKLIIQKIGQESEERKDQGSMIGVLVAKDESSSKRVYLAVSGNARTIQCASDFSLPQNYEIAPPIASSEEIAAALMQNDKEIHRLTELINSGDTRFLQKRKELTTESLSKVHDLYSFHCADGHKKSLKEICAKRNKGNLPPTGTGDCTAPKLLSHCFKNGMTPISMCEMFYETGATDSKSNGTKYEPCDERCGIILPEILGLEILYRDNSIVVVNKQSGLLSVPGRGPDKQDCITNRVKRLYPNCIEQPSVHRLDMETSGLMIVALEKEPHKILNKQFEEKLVQKEYVALIDGILPKMGIPQHGTSTLYFRLDIENRPHQIWDDVYGKEAVTEWEVLDVEKYTSPSGITKNVTRVKFIPHTGRTHQLRLASSDSHGFGCPIVGDTLYGSCEPGERLMLHAKKITFTHPMTNEEMTFECKEDF